MKNVLVFWILQINLRSIQIGTGTCLNVAEKERVSAQPHIDVSLCL